MDDPLFTAEDLCLGPIDHESDPSVEAAWSQDPLFLRAISLDVARPRTPAQVREAYRELERQADEKRDLFYFALRARDDDRLLGFARLDNLEWSHFSGRLTLGIGAAADRGRGLGTQALALVTRYAFDELNLQRLWGVLSAEYPAALRFFERAGWEVAARRRQAVHRDGRRWDLLHLALYNENWRPE